MCTRRGSVRAVLCGQPRRRCCTGQLAFTCAPVLIPSRTCRARGWATGAPTTFRCGRGCRFCLGPRSCTGGKGEGARLAQLVGAAGARASAEVIKLQWEECGAGRGAGWRGSAHGRATVELNAREDAIAQLFKVHSGHARHLFGFGGSSSSLIFGSCCAQKVVDWGKEVGEEGQVQDRYRTGAGGRRAGCAREEAVDFCQHRAPAAPLLGRQALTVPRRFPRAGLRHDPGCTPRAGSERMTAHHTHRPAGSYLACLGPLRPGLVRAAAAAAAAAAASAPPSSACCCRTPWWQGLRERRLQMGWCLKRRDLVSPTWYLKLWGGHSTLLSGAAGPTCVPA